MANLKPGISVCFIIKNGLMQGYPFWESLKSCLSFADEIVISEGHSTDGTADYIRKFAEMHSDRTKFRIYQDDWDSFSSPCGEVIAAVSEKNKGRCEYEWVYYLQADEILHEDNAAFVKSISEENRYNAVMFPFYHFLNSWNPMAHGAAAYDEAVRMIRNRKDIVFIGDAWTCGGAVHPICPANLVPQSIYHLGAVFPKNCDVKNVEHGKLYQNLQAYQEIAAGAKIRIEKGEYSALALPEGFDNFPDGVARLFGMVKYELPDEAME